MTARLTELIAAAFPGVLVTSDEPEEVLRDLARLCGERKWNFATWTADGGEDGPADPLAAVKALPQSGDGETPAVLAMVHLHRYFQSAELLAAVRTALAAGKTRRTHLVLIQPTGDLPAELRRDFVTVTHPLPSRDELDVVAHGVATEPGELPDELHTVLDAAAGLTRGEAENAFALSLVRHGKLDPDPLWELKAKQLAAGGPLTLHRNGPGFGSLGGLNALKEFCRAALTNLHAVAEPKGALLLGAPGTGKSAFAKALGSEVGRPTLSLDIGGLMGSLVGQSEENTRRALATVEAMAPCVLFIDEVEKALAGTSGGQQDSGVGARLLGTLLSWLADRPRGVFAVATSNDASRLPAELTRSGRFDATFFLDLPAAEERALIWDRYRAEYGIDTGNEPVDDEGWTGAEIESCCRLSALLNVSLAEAGNYVVPVSESGREQLAKLRRWASGRCLDAEDGGPYRHRDRQQSDDPQQPRRKTQRRPPGESYSLN
ncbi:AAA family ATPase [Alienimonas chondri]|uniref:AAA family ATPase n=1 Tax=Alienimonas chondri TaxID=2681879 RepID=UPI001FE92657|nr:AAA family ATPase [Alienimonas chondri]